MACKGKCEIREPVFTEQRLEWWPITPMPSGPYEIPLEKPQGENEHPVAASVRSASLLARDNQWKSTVIDPCKNSKCVCERTDKVLSGPTNPPKRRRITGSTTSAMLIGLFSWRLTLSRAWRTVEGLCVDDDSELEPEPVSFSPEDEQSLLRGGREQGKAKHVKAKQIKTKPKPSSKRK